VSRKSLNFDTTTGGFSIITMLKFISGSLSSSFWPKNLLLKRNIDPFSPDLAPNDFWLFPKIKSALNGIRFQDIEDIKKKSDDITESYSTTGVPRFFQQRQHR
jgi:hypothetical protein